MIFKSYGNTFISELFHNKFEGMIGDLRMPWLFDEKGNSLEIPSVNDYICSLPDSLYTAMRMNQNGIVFDLERHLERVKADHFDVPRILGRLNELNKQIRNDLRVTLIRISNSNSFCLIYEEMPTMNLTSCKIEIKLAHRDNVNEKNSQWVKERRKLEEEMNSDSNEVILVDEFGRLYEGLSSNFFILRSDGLLQTAPLKDVLVGTVLMKVIEEWKWGPIIYEHPLVDEIGNWLGAFITSTSRLILPINQISINGKLITIPSSEKIVNMRNRLQEAIQ